MTNLVPKIVLVATGTKWLQLGVLFRNKRLLCILYVQTYNWQDEVEMAKKDWELGHLQALKKEEEKRAAEEEDEILYTYTREESLQVKKNKSKLRRSKANSKCSGKNSLMSKRAKKNLKSETQSNEAQAAVRNSRSTSRTSSRASSRSSSCSSSRKSARRNWLW